MRRIVSIITRIVSVIAFIVGIVTFLSGLALVPFTVWSAIIPNAGGEFDIIGLLLCVVCVLSVCSFLPLATIGLVLSIVTLFIERNKRLRLLPLAFVLAGICLFAACYFLPDLLGA